MEKEKTLKSLALAIVAGLIVVGIVAIVRGYDSFYRVQIIPLDSSQRVKINSQELHKQQPNPDGILFINATGVAKEYQHKLLVSIQPKDVPDWFRQDDVQPAKGAFISRIQLGSREWPIKGGEEYILRVTAGNDSATARITVLPDKKQKP